MQDMRRLIPALFTAIVVSFMTGGQSSHADGVPKYYSTPPPPPPTKRDAVKADAGGPYKPVERGESVRLDGSRSTGRNLKYEWFFGPELECRNGAGNGDATKQGKRVEVTLLCSIEVILKVTSLRSGKSDIDSAKVKVKPRSWKMRVTHRSNWTFKPNWQKPMGAISANGPECKRVNSNQLGENYCALPHPEAPYLGSRGPNSIGALHPHGNRFHDTWLDHGYTVKQVRDKNGPFDGWYYIAEHELKLAREGVFNAHIGSGTDFHRINKAKDLKVKRFYKGLEGHEGWGTGVSGSRTGHSLIFKDFLKSKDGQGNSNDPAKRIEQVYAKTKTKLKEKADGLINDLNAQLAAKSADPIKLKNWRGHYWVYDQLAGKWCRDPFGDRM